jgi:sugar O-acyltransferase (sialic acid O-acetyltransferase NeuD family)
VLTLVDETAEEQSCTTQVGYPIATSADRWFAQQVYFFIAVGDNFRREQVYRRLRKVVAPRRFASIVHPDATISRHATIGDGCLILGGARVAAKAAVYDFSFLYANTAITHDNSIGRFVSVNAGAAIGGWCRVGDRTAVGLSSCLRERVSVGTDVVIGANTYVNRDLPSNSVAVGSPARIIRFRASGEPYLL